MQNVQKSACFRGDQHWPTILQMIRERMAPNPRVVKHFLAFGTALRQLEASRGFLPGMGIELELNSV